MPHNQSTFKLKFKYKYESKFLVAIIRNMKTAEINRTEKKKDLRKKRIKQFKQFD